MLSLCLIKVRYMDSNEKNSKQKISSGKTNEAKGRKVPGSGTKNKGKSRNPNLRLVKNGDLPIKGKALEGEPAKGRLLHGGNSRVKEQETGKNLPEKENGPKNKNRKQPEEDKNLPAKNQKRTKEEQKKPDRLGQGKKQSKERKQLSGKKKKQAEEGEKPSGKKGKAAEEGKELQGKKEKGPEEGEKLSGKKGKAAEEGEKPSGKKGKQPEEGEKPSGKKGKQAEEGEKPSGKKGKAAEEGKELQGKKEKGPEEGKEVSAEEKKEGAKGASQKPKEGKKEGKGKNRPSKTKKQPSKAKRKASKPKKEEASTAKKPKAGRRKKEKEYQDKLDIGEWFVQNKSLIIIGLTAAAIVCVLVGVYRYIVTAYEVTTVYVDGNVHYTNEEVMEMVMGGRYGNNSLYLAAKYKDKGIEGVPFVEKMDVNILSPDTIRISVYEKALAGYVEYLGRYMYFDRDGIVVESSEERTSGIPQVTGLKFDYVVLNDYLPVENDEIFKRILDITQLLNKYELMADKIFFDSTYELTLFFDGIRVTLGADSDIDQKIIHLKNILPNLEGKKGTLRMENYTEDTKNITFLQD